MIIGKYPAYVAYNDQTDSELPIKGAFKVICPDIYGHLPELSLTIPQTKLAEISELSPWVRPSFTHPTDFFVPELGEGVWVTFLRGDMNRPIADGYFPSDDFKNLFDKNNPVRDGISQAVSEPQTDRVIATRNGSYIKIEDKPEGKITIEVYAGAKNIEGDNSTRKGCKIELDPTIDAEKITVIAQTKDGAKQSKIEIDVTKDAEKIELITPKGAKLLLDDANGSEQVILEDTENGNKVTMDSTGIAIVDKQANKITLDDNGTKIKDKNGNEITMNSSLILVQAAAGKDLTIKGAKVLVDGSVTEVNLKSGDAVTWLPNILPVCLFTGAPHGGPGAGIVKLKGS